MHFPEDFFKNFFEKRNMNYTQEAIDELDYEIYEWGTYLSEKMVQYAKESGRNEIQKEDVFISLFYGITEKGCVDYAPIKRLIKSTGAIRVSQDAVETLTGEIQKEIITFLEKADDIATENKHRLITINDLEEARK